MWKYKQWIKDMEGALKKIKHVPALISKWMLEKIISELILAEVLPLIFYSYWKASVLRSRKPNTFKQDRSFFKVIS